MLDEYSYGVFSESVSNISLDRRCLLKIGAKKVSTYTSWASASHCMQDRIIDFALVDEMLEDMTGRDCVTLLKRNVSRCVPVIMVTADNRKDSVLNSISAGCGGYVLRPYSEETLRRHLQAALMSASPDDIEKEMLTDAQELVSNGQFDEALECLEELVEDDNPCVDYYKKGMKFLKAEKYGKAIIAFNKAVAMNEMYAEAYKAMADAYKGKGDMEKYQEYLTKAGDLYAEQDRMDDAKQVFIEILQNEPDALNPFNRLGVNLRKQGDYEGAIRAYNQAVELTPQDANLFYNMARAYAFAEDWDNALDSAEMSIKFDPNLDHAYKLRKQILKKKGVDGDEPLPHAEPQPPGVAAVEEACERVLMDMDN